MPHLDSQFYASQIFWLVIVFICIYFFVKNYFLPNIEKAVWGRSQKIAEDINFASQTLEENKNIKSEINEILQAARTEAFQISNDAMKNSEHEIHEQTHLIEKEILKKTNIKEEKLARIKNEMNKDLENTAQLLKKVILKNITTQYK